MYMKSIRRNVLFNISIALKRFKSSEASNRINGIGIEMIQEDLRSVLFPGSLKSKSLSPDSWEKIKANLDKLINNRSAVEHRPASHIDVRMPSLEGRDLCEHMKSIANAQIIDYTECLAEFVACVQQNAHPAFPDKWLLKPGWTRYSAESSESVAFPNDEALVFDVEIISLSSFDRRRIHFQLPVLATAMSKSYWYSWCSSRLFSNQNRGLTVDCEDLIPLDLDDRARVLVGHNVSFDRSFIREQYMGSLSSMRFLDTMSLHIATSGYTGDQRALSNMCRGGDAEKSEEELEEEVWRYQQIGTDPKRKISNLKWMHQSSPNNLVDVHRFYCKNSKLKLSKEIRSVFVDKLGSPENDTICVNSKLEEIINRFQDLMDYCAKDTLATSEIMANLYPLFLDRFPHPATLAGMFEMSTIILPVKKKNWEKFIRDSDVSYNDTVDDTRKTLGRLANDFMAQSSDRFESDPWAWSLNWTLGKGKQTLDSLFKLNKTPRNEKLNEKNVAVKLLEETRDEIDPPVANKLVESVRETAKRLPMIKQKKLGYPKWYKEICTDELDVFKLWFNRMILVYGEPFH